MQAIDDIRARLEAIAEELADLAFESLQDAVRSGKHDAAAERRLTRARRAVEKAAQALSPCDE